LVALRMICLVMLLALSVPVAELYAGAAMLGASAGGGRVYPDVLSRYSQNCHRRVSLRCDDILARHGLEKYANAFRVKTADEQPFIRFLGSVRMKSDIGEVIVDARDSVAGWGGESMRVVVPH